MTSRSEVEAEIAEIVEADGVPLIVIRESAIKATFS